MGCVYKVKYLKSDGTWGTARTDHRTKRTATFKAKDLLMLFRRTKVVKLIERYY